MLRLAKMVSPMELGAFAFSIITNLLSSVIFENTNYATLPFFQGRKIKGRIEDATAEVVEPLLPFLANEGISEDKQRRLIEICVDELRPLTKKPEQLFQGSLNGQKIFEELYANRDLPQVVIEDGLKDVYTLLCPRIATLLCKIPAAVKDWESEAWSENFRRFDEITSQLRTLFNRVDELATSTSRDADATLTLVRRTLAQKIEIELDITGLRADRPLPGKFDKFFVHPQLKEDIKSNPDKKQPRVVGEPDKSFELFTLKSHRAIVIGQPGAGKSTWAKWLQREALTTRWTGICVRVELRRFSSEDLLSLHELIREASGQHLAEDLTGERIGEWLKAKQIVFILDGFDEIRPSERDKLYKWIVELDTAVRECSFILTSRPLTTDHLERLSTSWHCWTIEPFDEDRIVDYIQRWYTHTSLLSESDRVVDARNLAANWRQDPTIEPLTGNPLLLSTLLMVNHLDGSLPSGRSKLYQRYVQGMLGLWDARRKVTATTIQLSSEEKWQIMRGFALKMFFQGQDQLDEPAALELVKELFQKINLSLSEEDVLAGIRERSGLIIGPGIYSFVHKSVAEYLVAEAVLQGDQQDESGRRIDRFCLFEQRDNDRWNTVTFLWAGLARLADLESFINQCISIKAWNLACGILTDQYEKISREIRRKLLLAIVSADPKSVHWEKNYGWGYPQPQGKKPIKLTIPTFELRSVVSSHEHFYWLVERAVEDGTLIWSDSSNVEGEFRDLLWMYCAKRVRTIEEWKTCLIAPCPNSAPSIDWLYWVAERVFKTVVTEKDSPQLELVVEAYKQACPHARGLVPIALMSVGLLLVSENLLQQPLEHNNFAKILKIFPNSDDGEIVQEWLVRTGKWMGRDVTPKDILTTFTEQVEELVKQGKLNQDEVYERAINFVEELRERREAISYGSSGNRP